MIELIGEALPLLMIGTLAVLLFSGFPVALVLAGVGVLFALLGVVLDTMPWIALYNFPLRIKGATTSFIFPAIPMLLFLGVSFEKSGVAREMLLCLQVLLRRVPGRLVISVTVLGILLGPLPGMIGVSVATLSLLALPTMLQQKYRPSLATGAIAAAGTLGVIIPPSVMLFFLAGQMLIPMGHVFLAVLIPSLLLSALYLVYYVVYCGLVPEVAPDSEHAIEVQGGFNLLFYSLRNLALPVVLISTVLGSIIAGWATPSQSGAIGAAGGLLLMAINRRFSIRDLHDVIVTTMLMTSMVFLIVIAAGIFSYPFRYHEGDQLIVGFLNGLGLGDWGLLIVILAILFVLGFFIDWIEITVITLPIFLPVLESLDLVSHVGNPNLVMVWISVLIGLVLQTSFMTPPFGFALFFVKGTAPPEVSLGEIYRGVIPLLGIQLLTVLLVMAVPVIATWLPELLLE